MNIKQFLDQVYLPGYVTVLSEDYEGNNAYFDFKPVEPKVTVFSDRYLTPRGTHILLSQASFCVADKLIRDRELLNPEEFYKIGFEGRLKLVEFNQRFRREIGLDGVLQGKLTLAGLKWGRLPVLKIDFDLGNRAISGNLTSMVAPYSVPQTNYDIMRHTNVWGE